VIQPADAALNMQGQKLQIFYNTNRMMRSQHINVMSKTANIFVTPKRETWCKRWAGNKSDGLQKPTSAQQSKTSTSMTLCADVINFLLKKVRRLLGPRNQKVAMTRIDKGCKPSRSWKTRLIRFKTLQLPKLCLADAIVKSVIPQLADWLPLDDSFLFEAKSVQFHSMKKLLNNRRSWFPFMDADVMPCTCSTLRSLCGLDDTGKHVCVRLRDSSFVELLPVKFSSDSFILPSVKHVSTSLDNTFAHIAKMTGIALKNINTDAVKSAIEMWMWKLRCGSIGPFVSFETTQYIKSCLNKVAVLSAVDKSKCDSSICCPSLMQDAVLNLHVRNRDVDMNYSEADVRQNFDAMKTSLAYSGIPFPINRHCFGFLTAVPKTNGMCDCSCSKWRPLGSYCKHCGRQALSCACKSLTAGTELILKKYDMQYSLYYCRGCSSCNSPPQLSLRVC